jgi:iron-sulfur cluster assembly protein
MLIDQTQVQQINLTSAAASAVRDLLAKRNLSGYALRVFVAGGGCSGFQYGMALEANIRDNDFRYEHEGIEVVVDDVSMRYLNGATIDFVESVMGSGFKIENPNAVSSCGCGSSFRTKDESYGSGGGCSSCG